MTDHASVCMEVEEKIGEQNFLVFSDLRGEILHYNPKIDQNLDFVLGIASILCAIEAWMHEVIPEGLVDGIPEYDNNPDLTVDTTVKWTSDLLRGLQGHTFAPLLFMNSVGWPYSFRKMKEIIDKLDGNAAVNLEVGSKFT